MSGASRGSSGVWSYWLGRESGWWSCPGGSYEVRLARSRWRGGEEEEALGQCWEPEEATEEWTEEACVLVGSTGLRSPLNPEGHSNEGSPGSPLGCSYWALFRLTKLIFVKSPQVHAPPHGAHPHHQNFLLCPLQIFSDPPTLIHHLCVRISLGMPRRAPSMSPSLHFPL